MNYVAHYEKLIARARGRVLTGYKERHHVLPRCMGGDNSPGNLVNLTAEEHYVAHQILCKTYPNHIGLLWAANAMTSGPANRKLNNKSYGWLRQRLAESLRGKPRDPEIVKKIAAAHRGKKLSQEHRAIISAVHFGVPKSAEHRKKIGIANKMRTAETRAKLSIAMRGNKHGVGQYISPERRARIGALNRGKTLSAETREKIAAARRGKPLSPEHCAKVSASLIGNKRTLGYKATMETRTKMSASRLGKKRGSYKKLSPHG